MTGWGTGYASAVLDGHSVMESKIEDALSPHVFRSTKYVAHTLGIPITEKVMQDLGQTLARMAREGLIQRSPAKKPSWGAWRR